MGLFGQIRQRLGRVAAGGSNGNAGNAGQHGATAFAATPASRKQRGDAAEASAVAFLQRQGLQLLERNYKTPGRGGGEIDAIMRAADGTLVFVEVRQRIGTAQGGAAASVGAVKQGRIVLAAQCYLQQFAHTPPCRFDVMACDGDVAQANWQWLQGAFDAGG